MAISIRETYRGKHVLVTGTTGFLGKIFLTLLLDRVDDVGRVYVLIRKKGLRTAQKRFEKIVNSSPVFRPLHETHGAGLSAWMSERVEVVQGDISLPGFGIEPNVLKRMQRDVDVVVNCAGLVDFNPDLREALASNVDGPLAAAHFVADCKKAGLVHVSTCYVVGNREGRIEERIDYGYTPKGLDFDPTQELSEVAELVESVLAEFDTDEAEADLMAEVDRLIEKRGLDKSNETLLNNMITRTRDDRIRRQMAKVGEKRAADWGWANTYTWSKSIGEQLLQEKANALGIRWSVLRPAIVESAQEFPFEGWNEGFNTCGPLVYLLGTWFKDLPCKKGLPFDIVPVDMVCKGLLTVGAAVILGEQRAVYHCGTSDRNRFTIERATELTALGHRRHLRKHGKNTLERMVLSRWDARHVSEDYVLSMRNIRKTASGLEKGLRKLNGKFGPGPNKLANAISQADKGLKQVEKVCDLFQPFIHDNVWVFETDGLVAHDVVEEDCRFAPESIHWRTWWLDVHMPGLRKWTFPHFQGKPVPTYKPEHKFELRAPSRATTGGVRAAARKA